jgi:hypothetical protein
MRHSSNSPLYWILASAAFDILIFARQSIVVRSVPRFGDGKPVALIPRHLGSDVALRPLPVCSKTRGYRAATAGPVLNLNLLDVSSERALSRLIRDITAHRTKGRPDHAFIRHDLRIAGW